jgi:hypothetical protein
MSTELGPHNLTSDTSSPPFVVSTVYSYTPGWQAFDGDLGTFWLEATGSPWTLEIDLGTPQVLGSYAMAIEFAGALSSGRTPSAWEMQGSNDGSSWTALDTQTGITWPSSETQTFTLATVSAARRYYRLHITASNGDATYCGISELYLYQGTATIVGTTPQTITFPPIPDRLITDTRSFVLVGSSDSGLPLSYAVTSGLATISGSTITITGSGSITLTATQAGSGTYAAAAPVSQTFAVIPELGPHDLTSDTSHPPFVVSTAGPTYSPEWQAFDGNLDTYWLGQSGSPWTLEIDLGTPQVLGSYAMAIEFAGALSSGRTPSAWEMQGSNDGSSWTALDTQTGITWPSNETQTFTLATASAACRYYRLHITASNGDATYCGISELYLYQGTATIVGTTPQTITFPPVLAQTTGALVTLGAASDSGLAVNYSVTRRSPSRRSRMARLTIRPSCSSARPIPVSRFPTAWFRVWPPFPATRSPLPASDLSRFRPPREGTEAIPPLPRSLGPSRLPLGSAGISPTTRSRRRIEPVTETSCSRTAPLRPRRPAPVRRARLPSMPRATGISATG